MSVQPVLQLDRVSKSFGPVKVIDSVSIDVHAGHVQALLGENGAGKSTLIKMMAGVYQPDSGQILVDGTPTTLPNVKAAEAHGIATIHQELNLVPTMTVAENLMLGRTPSRWGLVDYKELRKKALKALRMIGVDVSLDTPVGELGIARQQLVEIAKALSMNARVLILDEPTAGVDVELRHSLWQFMQSLNRQGHTIVLTTHYLEEAEQYCGRVAIMKQGRLVALDTTENLLRQEARLIWHITLDKALPESLQAASTAQSPDFRYTLLLDDYRQLGEAVAQLQAAGCRIEAMDIEKPNLEQVFMRLTAHNGQETL